MLKARFLNKTILNLLYFIPFETTGKCLDIISMSLPKLHTIIFLYHQIILQRNWKDDEESTLGTKIHSIISL